MLMQKLTKIPMKQYTCLIRNFGKQICILGVQCKHFVHGENHDWLLWKSSSIIFFCCLVCSRLCNDKRLAEEVVRLEGLGRLVELCKNESARVGSDGVLVACLAAVRKIAAAVGPEKFKNLDATELVEPRLLDSFLIFSSRNESFFWLIFFF